MIAFVGSVFSPYYAWQRWRQRDGVDAEDHCALNLALYGADSRRWTMTERGRRQVARSATRFGIGRSELAWTGDALVADVDEWAVPLPRRVRGRIRLHPLGLNRWTTALDASGLHRWGPLAACARIEVDMEQPRLSWRGRAYFDANDGDEPLDRPFHGWDWARGALSDGGTAVVYDVRRRDGSEHVIARRFATGGDSVAFEAPARRRLPRSRWGLSRHMRSEDGEGAQLQATLEDTPFYVRSQIGARLLREPLTAVHESLDLSRAAALPVRLMLPFRMPRRP